MVNKQLGKINVTILHGSSCVGKSTIMRLKSSKFYQIEMDDIAYWKFDNPDVYCLNYLSKKISENTHKKNFIVTCGALPLPNHPKYSEIEKKHGVSFLHTLVLTRDIEDYIKNIKARGMNNKKENLIRDYNWRKSTIDLYDNIIFNNRKNVLKRSKLVMALMFFFYGSAIYLIGKTKSIN